MPVGSKPILTATVALLLSTASAALAARTDVIVLRNGDRVTGEVVQMRQGKLRVKTDDIGTLSIEWDKVVALTTAERYDLTTRDGTRWFGRLRPGAANSLEIVADDDSVASVLLADVVSFAAIKTSFLRRIDGSLDLGASYTQSSGVGQLSFETEAIYRRPSFAFAASLSTYVTRQADVPDTSRYSLKLDYTNFRRDRWLLSAFGLFESNEELGFTFRGTGAGSVGRYLWMTDHVEFLVAGGLAMGREMPVDSDTVTNVDSLIAMDLSVFAHDYPSTRIDFSLMSFPSLDDPGRVRLNADAKFKRELFRNFFFSINAYDAFDNRPKSDVARQNDVGGSISFGWTF